MARPGLEPMTSRIPCEHSGHWATKPHSRPVTISLCLIRFGPESARNHARTDETVPLLLAARARTTLSHQMSQGRKKHMARPGLEPRTSLIPCEHSGHWATEPQSRPVTISPCLIRFVPESARNHAGVPLLLAAQTRTQTEPPNATGEEKHTTRPGVESRTSHLPFEHYDHWATEPHGRHVTYTLQITYKSPASRSITFVGRQTSVMLITIRFRIVYWPNDNHSRDKELDMFALILQ